ncbi:MAG: hypothetical protein WC732_08460 [Candidatus Omnitrophota bacterium]
MEKLPPIEETVNALIARLAAGTATPDAVWFAAPANHDKIERLCRLIEQRRVRATVSFKSVTDVAVVCEFLVSVALAERTTMGRDVPAKLLRLAVEIVATRPPSIPDLQQDAIVAGLRMPKYVWKALHRASDAIEWATPDGRPMPTWTNMLWTTVANTPTYDMRREHMWSLIVERARAAPVAVPDRASLVACSARLEHRSGGAAPLVHYTQWTYGQDSDGAAVAGFPAPVPRQTIGQFRDTTATIGRSREENLGIYYIYVHVLDAPDVLNPVQVYVGKATPNIRFRIYDTAGHWGAVRNLAEIASGGGSPPLPRAAMLVDLALLWTAMGNGGTWTNMAAVVAVGHPTDGYDLGTMEHNHVERHHANDMRFGLNGTKGG